jgi:HAD superfamily hydrolase (TIGR01509 family)
VSPPLAVILDFNGTLSDDEPLLGRLFREVLAEAAGIEMTPADYFERFAGLSDPEIAESALRAGGIDPSPALIERILRAKIDGYLIAVEEEPPIVHAATEFVETVADRVPIAIASGAFREEIELVLGLAGIRDRFDAVVCIDDVGAGKPDPEGYLVAHRRMNEANGTAIAAADTLAIEDSAVGVAAAHQAGLRCAAIAGDARAGEVADFTIPRLDGDAAERLLRG